jgi:hypothetical protein
MKKIFPTIFFAAMLLWSCHHEPVDTAVPICVQDMITQLKQLPKFNPPAQVSQYTYNGQTVYYFTSDCCDQFNYLYDGTCQPICAPDGGITGNGDGKCADFWKTAKLDRVIWKDQR